MNRKVLIIIFMQLWLLSLGYSQKAQRTIKEEYEVKAAFLARFAEYISWPEETGMDDVSKPFVIGIIGKSPISAYIEDRLVPKGIRGKKVVVRYFTSPEEINGCHILFIAASAEKDLARVLAVTKNKPVLTVGDTENFSEKGVYINLYQEGTRVRFEINETGLRSSALVVNPQLLRLARIVNPLAKRNRKED